MGLVGIAVVSFVGYVLGAISKAKTQQASDNSAREKEILGLKYDLLKQRMDTTDSFNQQYASRSDMIEVKKQLSFVVNVVEKIAARLHIDAVSPE